MTTCPSLKKISSCLCLAIFLLVILLLTPPQTLAATGINKQINFQGKVVNKSDSTNIANGNYDFEFKIYTVASGGTAIWTETRTSANQVTVTDGIFRVSLGSITSLPGSIDFNTDNIYLGINFNNDGEMSSRVQFTAVPYAFNALKVAGLTVTDTTGTFTLAAAKTLTVSDSTTLGTNAITLAGGEVITFSATNALSLLTTGTTSVTLPTSGTLVSSVTTGNGVSATNTAGALAFTLGAITPTTVTSPTYTGTGAVTVSSGGTSGLTIDSASGDVTIATGDSITFAAGTGSGNVTINAGATGTTANLLVKLDTSGTVITTDTTTLNNAVGVALDTKTSGQAVRVAIHGVVTVVADNAVTAGDYIGLGTTTAGRAKSLGSTYPTTAGIQVIGRATSSQATPGSTFTMILEGLDNNVSAGAACSTCLTLAPSSADTANNSNNLIFANQQGTGNLLGLQQNGTNKVTIANNGGLTISGATTDIVKSTTGTTNPTDYSLTGSTLKNVTSQNNNITINDCGTMPCLTGVGNGTFATSTIVTAAAAGAGAHTIIREDGQYIIIHGGAAATASRWDGVSATMTSVTVATGATLPGAGALSLKRTDGRYLLIHGNASAGLTSVFDPWNVTAAAAGAPVCGAGAATTGTTAFQRDDGKYVILCGALTAWGTYDPNAATAAGYTGGTAVATAFGAGAMAIHRDDGTFLVLAGGNGTAEYIYNPYASATGTMTAVTLTGAPTVNTGATALRRQDGKFLVMGGAINTSNIYDPTGSSANPQGTWTAQTVSAGFGPTVALGDGAQVMWRPDWKYTLVIGGASTVTNVIDPSKSDSTQFVAGNSLAAAPGAGFHMFFQPDGKYRIIRGGATTTTDTYDVNFVIGGPIPLTALTAGAPTAGGSMTNGTHSYKVTFLSSAGESSAGPVSNQINSTGTNQTSALSNIPTGPLGTIARRVYRTVTGDTGNYLFLTTIADNVTTTFSDTVADASLGAAAPTGREAYYETECISASGLNINSTLNWQTNSENIMSFLVRTGTACPLSSATYKQVLNSGDPIRPASGDNKVQIRVIFQRQLPVFADQEWGLRRGLSQVRYRRINQDPTLFNVSVDNGNLFRRTAFDFGIGGGSGASSSDPSGPLSVNLMNVSDRNLAAALSSGVSNFASVYGATVNATNPGFYNGNFETATALAAAPAAGAGSVVMRNPDGTFMVVTSNATANAQLYDPVTQVFTNQPAGSTRPSAAIGAGALAFKRPDGKFVLILGGATTTVNIYDPVAKTFTNNNGANQTTIAAVGQGSQMIPLPTGRVLVLHGNNTTASSIYDPLQNVFYSGPITSAAAGIGTLLIPLPNGKWVLSLGQGGTAPATCPAALLTVSNTFDPYTMQFTATGSPALTTGPGAFAFQRSDGLWVIARGGATITACTATTTTDIYNPFTNKTAAGPALSAAAQMGAMALPRPDGTWLIIHGSATSATTTSIYIEKAGAFTAEAGGQVGQFVAGPALITGAGSGAVAFQRQDGKFVVLVGNATTGVNVYDGGWVATGIYKSEQVNIADLDTSSTLVWKSSGVNAPPTAAGIAAASANALLGNQAGISAEVRTANSQANLQTATWRDIGQSGGLINPAASETWLQINFNFKRSFPSYSGLETDVWYDGGGANSMFFPQRPVYTPILNEFKVTKDVNLVNLQADGLSMFRVSSSGDIFTSPTGTVNSGGADLAERYTSQIPLENGSVVSIDPQNSHGVKLSNYQYQQDILGVVSTAPGFVAGGYTEDSYPIALIGRVPVKVSTENGTIHTGDYLTSSSVPGYAMKADKAGRVLGIALENLDTDKLTDCPASDMYVSDRKCGEIVMFVNLTDYFGQPVELAMAEKGQVLGLSSNDQQDNGVGVETDQRLVKADQILNFLKDLKAQQEASGSATSEVFTDRVSATNEVISPLIVTDLLRAKKIKADSIEGLEILTDKISSLGQQVAGLSTQSQTASSSAVIASIAKQSDSSPEIASMSATPQSNTVVTLGKITIETAEVKLDLTVLGKLETQGGLIVGGPAEFNNDTIFNSLASFISKVIFKGDAFFEGRPTFNSDTAGFAVIKKDADNAEVVFDKEYATTPIITVNMTFDPVKLADGQLEDSKVLQKRVADSNYSYFIVNRTTKGFTIVLNKNASEDLTFSWIALSVKDAKRFESKIEPTPTPSAVPVSASPAPSASPSVTPSAAPVATSSAGMP